MAATATEAAGPGGPVPEGLSARQAGFLVAVLLLSVLTGVMHYAGVGAVATFIVAGVALGGLAWAIGFATEAVADRFGPAVTGVLQSTLGNLPELFVVLFALRAGEIVVAQTSIIGSLFANALLVLGMTILAGAYHAPDGVMHYTKRLPNDTATLLLLAVFIIVLLGLSNEAGDPASRHQEAISAVGAVCLLIVYAFWLWGYLRGAPTTEAARGHAEAGAPTIGLAPAVGLLALSGLGAALVSEWFVAELDPAVRQLGVSKAFTGLVIVAIAGNAVEHFVGITLAWKGKAELAISVVKNSVAQIAAFLFPALVLLSFFFATPLTFVLAPVYVGALALMAISVWQVTGDGESVAFEGWALVALYVVLAVVAWFE